MTERATQQIGKAEQGLDYSVAGVSYYVGDREDSTPQIYVPNETLGHPVKLVDSPELVLSWEPVAESRRIDERRTFEFDADDNLVGVIFDDSKDGVNFEGLSLSEQVISTTRELIAAFQEDLKLFVTNK